MTQINNLNIFTFIKDIYQSLKHIDQCFSTFNESVNTRLTKLEDNQQILIDKLASIEIALIKLGEVNNTKSSLDKNIENELMKKMNIMNKTAVGNDTVDLKPNELTFANILENGYTLLDINESLCKYDYSSISNVDGNNMNDNLNNYINENLNDSLNDSLEHLSDNKLDNLKKDKKETLDSLLF
jgi:hypothetical protein